MLFSGITFLYYFLPIAMICVVFGKSCVLCLGRTQIRLSDAFVHWNWLFGRYIDGETAEKAGYDYSGFFVSFIPHLF